MTEEEIAVKFTASCHVANIIPNKGGTPIRVLGVTSHFDVEAFFGAVTVATFRTAEQANMKRFWLFRIPLRWEWDSLRSDRFANRDAG